MSSTLIQSCVSIAKLVCENILSRMEVRSTSYKGQELAFHMPNKYLEWETVGSVYFNAEDNFQISSGWTLYGGFRDSSDMFREGFTDDTMFETQKLNSSISWPRPSKHRRHACNSLLVPHLHYRFCQGEHSDTVEDAKCWTESNNFVKPRRAFHSWDIELLYMVSEKPRSTDHHRQTKTGSANNFSAPEVGTMQIIINKLFWLLMITKTHKNGQATRSYRNHIFKHWNHVDRRSAITAATRFSKNCLKLASEVDTMHTIINRH